MSTKMRILHFVSRTIIGVVFMFSGFVKGIDPLGTAYRLEDYFMAWGTDWMMPAAVTLSVLLSTMEFVLGFVVLFNLKPKVNAWMLLGVMIYFTGLTLYDAVANPVPDCGCFGDAIKLTNVQTFLKNVILFIPTIILFIWRKKAKDRYSNLQAYGTAGVITAFFAGMCLFCIMHLPIIDFMEWKKGNKMFTESNLPVKYYLTYRNKQTGETKEYLSPDYPFNDSVWMSQWEFVDQRVDDPNEYLGADLQIVDLEGNDVTNDIIRDPGYHFMLITWDIAKANKGALKSVNDLAMKAESDGYGFASITSSLPAEIDTVSKQLNLRYTFYQADDVALKIMVRSNPGLILMKAGVVIDKWAFRDIPDYKEIKKEMIADQ